MLAIKISNFKDSKTKELKKTINNLVGYVHEKIKGKSRIVSDYNSIEIISGKDKIPSDDYIVAELVVKQTIFINTKDFDDKQKLDKFIKNIKHFCDKAKDLEEIKHVSL